MPIYTYKCTACGHEFDEIVKYDDRDVEYPCKLCKKVSKRKVAVRFGLAVELNPQKDTVYSPQEIDRVVGKDAEVRWQNLEERRKQRWKDAQDKKLIAERAKDGTVRPVEVLGSPNDQKFRKEYSEALKVHREEREKKGLGQFEGPGTIEA